MRAEPTPTGPETEVSSEIAERMRAFLRYAATLAGYEKGEAQVFCDRLFQAFGHEGYKEAGAQLEFQVKKLRGRGTKFADLLWRPRVLIEMKSRGESLAKHSRQAFEYWIEIVPDRPSYVVLCNFDDFWIYDFNTQLDSPVDQVSLEELPDRYSALNFLFPENPRPLFGNDKVKVTREAADKVARVFNALVSRGEPRERAQRYILQCVVAMFSEDFDLLPKDLFTQLLTDCVEGESAYDLIGGLFQQMAKPHPARGGRFRDVAYFNGGLFEEVQAIELDRDEAQLLLDASSEQWASVAPPIFGTIFQSSMGQERRHALGAHFTSEADIQKVVLPTVVVPWQEKIYAADTLRSLEVLLDEIRAYRVLDPACGSGNFLYVAYRELVNLEMEILRKIHENFGFQAQRRAGELSLIGTTQFYGIDIDAFAVELARVTLMLAKRIALAETKDSAFAAQRDLPFEFEKPLPLDNLDKNIVPEDALFCDWPQADAIIGNPPYQSKNKAQQEYGRAYMNRVHKRYPEVPGHADYCVYWFRRAHDELRPGARAGLVGTNTIRQNYSREGGLDHIVENGGTITQAVSTQVWSGEAAVHVSIVNWVKGEQAGKKKLFRQLGDNLDSPWQMAELDRISASLSGRFDVTKARVILANRDSGTSEQGQTHGHKGFLLSDQEAARVLALNPRNAEVVRAYLTADELLGVSPPGPQRYVIDFHPRNLIQVQAFATPFERIRTQVLPTRESAAVKEVARNEEAIREDASARINKHHANFLKRWWLFSYPRPVLMKKIRRLKRYIACGRVTKRPVFAFIASEINPNDALQVFLFDDDYSFGVLQSFCHWDWFTERCSTLKGDFRYTATTVYDTFPWPQGPTLVQARRVAKASRELRKLRAELIAEHSMTLRELYRTLELPGENPLKAAHGELDDCVRDAYGMGKRDVVLEFLFELNQELARREEAKQGVVPPGLPPCVNDPNEFITGDSIGGF